MSEMLVANGTPGTLDPQRQVIDNGTILIRGNTIEAVGESEDIKAVADDVRILNANGKIVFPGLINTHTHIFQTLLRGIGQDLPVWEWFSRALDTTVGYLFLARSFYDPWVFLGMIAEALAGTHLWITNTIEKGSLCCLICNLRVQFNRYDACAGLSLFQPIAMIFKA